MTFVVGYLITYFGPLAFVLAVTIGKEAWDDVHRWMRDREANKEKFLRLTRNGFEEISSADIRVGHIIQVTTFFYFRSKVVVNASDKRPYCL